MWDPYRLNPGFHSRKNGVRSVRTRQRKRCAAKAPHGRRGQVFTDQAVLGVQLLASFSKPFASFSYGGSSSIV